MSLKKMAVKMALAFAAAKGVQAYRQGGGMKGVRDKLNQSQAGSGGGLGGLLGSGGQAGGLGGLLGSLGMGTTAGAGAGAQAGGLGSLGGLLGGLAGATGGAAGEGKMRGLLESTRETPPDTPEEEETAGLMIRAMIQAARADGEIDADERATLMEVIGDSDPDETAFIQEQLSAPLDPAGLARDVPKGHELEVYTASVLAIDPDNQAEAQHLHTLAEGLGLSQRMVNDVHEAHGKPPLYTL